MRMLVLGAGLQGSACAFDLLQNPDVTEVRLADLGGLGVTHDPEGAVSCGHPHTIG